MGVGLGENYDLVVMSRSVEKPLSLLRFINCALKGDTLRHFVRRKENIMHYITPTGSKLSLFFGTTHMYNVHRLYIYKKIKSALHFSCYLNGHSLKVSDAHI